MNKYAMTVAVLVLVLSAGVISAQAQDGDLRRRFDLQPVPPVPYPANNGFNPERVELGRLLFFDPILSGEKDTACATCHLPTFGMADGRQLAAGASGKSQG